MAGEQNLVWTVVPLCRRVCSVWIHWLDQKLVFQTWINSSRDKQDCWLCNFLACYQLDASTEIGSVNWEYKWLPASVGNRSSAFLNQTSHFFFVLLVCFHPLNCKFPEYHQRQLNPEMILKVCWKWRMDLEASQLIVVWCLWMVLLVLAPWCMFLWENTTDGTTHTGGILLPRELHTQT